MRYRIRIGLLVAAAISLSNLGVLPSQQNERGQSSPGAVSKQGTETIPSYHKTAKDAKPLPRLLPPSTFSDRPLVARAYQIASEIPLVLAQQPCYCRCDKAFAHSSLLDCFASSHTAGCGICIAETFLAFQMTKQGKTPAQIRAAIIRGDWKRAEIKQSK